MATGRWRERSVQMATMCSGPMPWERRGFVRSGNGDGQGVRRAVGVLLEELVGSQVLGHGGSGLVEVKEEEAALGLGEEGEGGDGPAGVGGDAREQDLEMVEEALDSGVVEEVGVELQGAGEARAGLGHEEGEVELGGAGVGFDGGDAEVAVGAGLEAEGGHVLHDEHDLEEG
jgi:hypothetical protein